MEGMSRNGECLREKMGGGRLVRIEVDGRAEVIDQKKMRRGVLHMLIRMKRDVVDRVHDGRMRKGCDNAEKRVL